MKVTQTWVRNEPSKAYGESITLTTIYSSQTKSEIDDLEQKMPRDILVVDGDTWKEYDRKEQ